MLDTERSVLSAEDSLTSSEAEIATTVIRIYKAVGGGWTETPAADAGTRQSQ